MARLALLLYEDKPQREQVLLARTLEFFGVPCKMLALSALHETSARPSDSVVFGSVADIARALRLAGANGNWGRDHAAFYAYAGPNRTANDVGLKALLQDERVWFGAAPEERVAARVSAAHVESLGAMAGIEALIQMRKDDAVLLGLQNGGLRAETLISIGAVPAYVRFWRADIPIYLCASSHMIDIEEEIRAGFYDVKEHFCSAVPLVSFIKSMFQEVAWQPQELGACLIIDDPLLKERYGACDFRLLRDLMQQYGFTTNIAFIPWNWWRTSRAASKLFGYGTGPFSISIHGCDHIKSEFGDSSPMVLLTRARLARERMQRHEARTGIHHDPIMVFPQGVFSSACPEIMKRGGFLAAVNTEISPVDHSARRARIRDVWDIATMRYGNFPVFTRRYAHHGIENFAFDLLLGKPCLIVAHHGFFGDQCAAWFRLLNQLQTRNCSLHWRPLGAVVRRACRRRTVGEGTIEVQMYGTELSFHNVDERPLRVLISSHEADSAAISEIQCNGEPSPWRIAQGRCSFETTIPAKSERLFRILYRAPDQMSTCKQTVVFRSSVAARRVLSELRDASLGKFAAHSFAGKRPKETGKRNDNWTAN
jgi:hypothetical protein